MKKSQQIKEEADKRLKIFEKFVDILVFKYGYRHNFFLTDFYSVGIATKELYFKAPEIKRSWQKHLENKNNDKHFAQLYIGTPYCASKCSYCMYFKEIGAPKRIEEYKNNLIASINYFSDVLKNITFDNIYFGGGTPSLFSEKQLQEICHVLKNKIHFKTTGERTCECNPSSATLEKLKTLKKAGFNRVSFGVQSLNKKVLKDINRDYQNFSMVKESILGAKKAGIKYINVDLMLGLYNDTPLSFIDAFKKIISLKPYALRVYSVQPIKSYLDKYFQGKLSNFEKHFEKQKKVMDKLCAIAAEMNFSYEKKGLKFNKRSSSAIDFRNKDISPLTAVYLPYYIEDKEASLFCLGHAGNSYIHNQIRYRSEPLSKNPNENTYVGIKTDRRNEMTYFLLNNLSNNKSLSLKSFKKVFNTELKDEFDYEIKLLKSLKQIEFKKDEMIFLPVKAKERFTYSMFFIPYDQLLKNMRNLLNGKGKTLPIKNDSAIK
ncbi:MAG: radical SAM protein [Elusimicrobia bacterium]|nr:radical SAM protein [Patescibacteria group bacterium]MCG2724761.1 radical SAM protein [Elusimicrobiota bacterium]